MISTIRLSNTMGWIFGLTALVMASFAHGETDLIPPAGPHGRLSGIAVFHDADTLVIDGKKIRLSYVDAPELDQVCQYRGHPWKCGVDARDAVIALVDDRPVVCNLRSFQNVYSRWDAICYTSEGIEINAWSVQNGWTRAYPGYATRRYFVLEEAAKSAKLNLWQPNAYAQPPWEYRQQRCTGLQARSEFCRNRPQ